MIYTILDFSNLNVWLAAILLVAGIFMIIKGGDWFVDSASWMAEVTGIPKLIIGATIVSIGTTLPEMLVSLFSAAGGQPEEVNVCIGNAVGSVTANIGLIMALSILAMPAIIKRKDYMLKSCLMLGAALVTAVGGFITNSVNIYVSITLIAIFVTFMTENIIKAIKESKENKDDKEEVEKDSKTVVKNILMFIFGAAFIVFGADFLVEGCMRVGGYFGGQAVTDIMSVTVVAVGTSLPELITTLTAIKKKESSLSVGNIIGANVMDLTLIMPLSCLVYGNPLPLDNLQKFINIPACLIVGAIAVIPALISKKFKKWQGVALLTVYVSYVTLVCLCSFGVIVL